MLAKHRIIFSLIVAVLIVLLAIVAIFWARGFKPDFKKGQIDRTGIIVASSIPTGAQVYLDDRLTSATNTNIAFLEPKTYKLKIDKDGYTSWEKDIEVKADLATEIKALLFPVAPQIKPLTLTGAVNPVLSPDSSKIVYGVRGDRGGLYLLMMNQTPLPFRQNTRLLAKNQGSFDFSQSTFIWSPDSRQVIVQFKDANGQVNANLLIEDDKTDQDLHDISGSLNATLASWQDQLDNLAQTLALAAPESVKSATAEAELTSSQLTVDPSTSLRAGSSQKKQAVNNEPTTTNLLNYFSTGLIFSPDENKILFKNKEEKYKIYDLKAKKESTLSDFDNLINISWYPDSAHIVVAQKELISIIETDGANKMTVFSGKFENGFVFAHPTGDSLVILTTLTQPEGTPANLYGVNLR